MRATELLEALTVSRGLQMGDALISATGLAHGLPVLTANLEHSTVVPGLRVEGFSLA